LKIGDFVMEIAYRNPDMAIHVARNFKAFFTDLAPDIRVNVLDWPNRHPRVRVPAQADAQHWYDSKLYKYDFGFRMAKSAPVVDVLLPASFEADCVDNFLRMVLSSRGMHKDVLMLHASGIVRGDQLTLFVAPSGTGKSTIAGLSGHLVFHDDIIALQVLSDGWVQACSVPFKPPFVQKELRLKLDAVYRIFQSTTDYCKAIPAADQFAQLVFALWNLDELPGHPDAIQANNQQLMRIWASLLPHVKVAELHFTKSTAFLQLI
jgi:hypothetical protein